MPFSRFVTNTLQTVSSLSLGKSTFRTIQTGLLTSSHADRVDLSLSSLDSGSAFPATLALQIRSLEPRGFKLDGVVTVIDCVNFRGYEDASPSAKVNLSITSTATTSD